MTFSSILSSFQGFFSRSFWFGRFLPVAVVAVLHLLLARALIGWQPLGGLPELLSASAGEALFAFALLVVLAYLLSPLVPVIGGLLDGSLLPEGWHNALRVSRRPEWEGRLSDYAQKRAEVVRWRRYCDEWVKAFREARGKGSGLEKNGDVAQIQAAADAFKALLAQPNPAESALREAKQLLIAALETNSADLDDSDSIQLDNTQSLFRKFLFGLQTEAEHQLVAAHNRALTLDYAYLQPTRFGDARQLLKRYVRDTYGVPSSFLWPRARLAVIAGEDITATGMPRQVADRISQSDFAVLLLALWWTVPLVWIMVQVTQHGSPWAVLALGAIAPLIGQVLYELAVRSEIEAGNAIGVVIDRYRRDALREFGFTPPATLSAERSLWKQIEASSSPGNRTELFYAATAGAPT